jgi:hypothetical protein
MSNENWQWLGAGQKTLMKNPAVFQLMVVTIVNCQG